MLDENLVEISGESFVVDMMYARTDNMTMRAVYEEIGFGNKAYIHKDVWKMLQKLIPVLNERHLKLKICDAYRPPFAHKTLKEIVPLPGFFASIPQNSLHCHGTAIDVVLIDESNQELPFPTKVDAYELEYAKQIKDGDDSKFNEHLQKARQDYQNPDMAEEIANREMLKQMMTAVGLQTISSEWWHYELPDGKSEAYPILEWQKD